MDNYYCKPVNFTRTLRQNNVPKLSLNLIDYIQEKTYKRWIRDKSCNPNPLDWIDLKYRKINRECWGKNNTKEIYRALNFLNSKNIIIYDECVSKMRINYKIGTWNI